MSFGNAVLGIVVDFCNSLFNFLLNGISAQIFVGQFVLLFNKSLHFLRSRIFEVSVRIWYLENIKKKKLRNNRKIQTLTAAEDIQIKAFTRERPEKPFWF